MQEGLLTRSCSDAQPLSSHLPAFCHGPNSTGSQKAKSPDYLLYKVQHPQGQRRAESVLSVGERCKWRIKKYFKRVYSIHFYQAFSP